MDISLKAARINANLTQEAAAKLIGVSPTSLIKWEKGVTQPRTMHFLKMCSVYGIDPSIVFLPKKLGKVKKDG